MKTAEATASFIVHTLKKELTKTPIRMAGAWLAKNAFRAIRNKLNPDIHGGSPLLGINGTCIIAHGSSSAMAIKNAIRVAADFVEQGINPRIVEALKEYNAQRSVES